MSQKAAQTQCCLAFLPDTTTEARERHESERAFTDQRLQTRLDKIKHAFRRFYWLFVY